MDLPQLVIFDLAGTTVEDRGEVPAAFAAALASEGIAVTQKQLSAVRGASKRQAVHDLLPPGPDRAARAERVYAAFKAHLVQHYATSARAIPGAAETFAWLRDRGVKIALNTGFDREIAELLLAALGWGPEQYDALVCGDEVHRGRPAPDLIFRCLEASDTLAVSQVAAVGDTTLDLEAARNAGVRWQVGVLSGAHSREQLERVPHTQLVPSVAELPGVWSGPDAGVYVAVRADMPEEALDWGTLQWLSSARLAPGAALTVGYCQIWPGRRNPLHYHPNCEEVLYVLTGRGRHRLDEQEVELAAGGVIRIPAGVRHNLANTGDDVLTCLIAFSAGQRETVFLEYGLAEN